MRSTFLRRATVLATIAGALLALPASAAAVLAGPNGRIVFTSGRAALPGDDSQAKLYLRTITSSTGGGVASPTITPFDGVQHRHPTWSPDRTRVAYAAGNPATNDFDIYILNLTIPGAVPLNITNSPGVRDDNPAWSPDGTRIAYESQVTAGASQSDIIVASALDGIVLLNLTAGSPTTYETTPAWTPNSARIVYATGAAPNNQASNLKSKPSGGGTERFELDLAGDSAYQPSMSPDGTRYCYTHHPLGGDAEVHVALFNGQDAGTSLSINPASHDYNCTWSPDGTLIAYASGAFTQAALVMRRSDGTGGIITLEDSPNHFDGNPDWAPDGSPTCEAASAATTAGTPVSISLACVDTGPAYEHSPVTVTTGCASCTQPANGTLGTIQQGTPATVTYTPNPGFSGTDTFIFSGFDARSFATPVTATITVAPAPAPTPPGDGGGGGGLTDQPPFPAKLAVARARVLIGARQLDVLAPITARASGRVNVSFQAGGRTERFTAAVDARNARVRFTRGIPQRQARVGTGILTLAYPGNAVTQPQEVRLRAASVRAGLVPGRPRIANGRLTASGRISDRARGVVRLQVLYEPPGAATRTLSFNARIANGRYRIDRALPADVVAEIGARRGVVHSYTLFTGYLPARMRGEMASFEVLGNR